MNPKERLLAAIRGEEVDRLPWSPFLAYFWEAQPEETRNIGQLEYMESLGADPLLRGFMELYSIKHKKCSIKETRIGNEQFTVYETPVGNLTSRHVYSPHGDTWFLMEHPVKTEEDFKILAYLNEDAVVVPDMSYFDEEYNRIGNRGLLVPIIGSESKTCFQSMVEHWVGTEELVYAIADYPQAVEECLQAMLKNSMETVRISAQSRAEAFIFWEDSSTTNISPAYFEKYTMPEINAWGKILHNNGKYLIHHACGHLKALLPLMAKTEIDMIESISPPPTGNIELWEAEKLLPRHIGLIGGIEPTVFLNSTLEELEEYVSVLLKNMSGKHFILANSDSCPPGVSLEKFRLVTDMLRR